MSASRFMSCNSSSEQKSHDELSVSYLEDPGCYIEFVEARISLATNLVPHVYNHCSIMHAKSGTFHIG